MQHLDTLLQQKAERSTGECVVNIDLSRNYGITDAGVVGHLVPFLEHWPVCHRLKLYKTSIGDEALSGLSNWVARGYVHELHLSDLGRQVSNEAVFAMLSVIHN